MILPSTLHHICGQGRHSHPSLCQVYLFKVEREINPQNGCLKAVMRLSTQFCLISTWHSLIQSCNPSLIYSSISSFTIVIYQWIQEHEDLFYFLCSVVYLLIYLFIYLSSRNGSHCRSSVWENWQLWSIPEAFASRLQWADFLLDGFRCAYHDVHSSWSRMEMRSK